MWDFFQTIRLRHSVRRYLPQQEVGRDKLHAILETACAAPSAGDLQSYRIIVVQDAATRQALRGAAGNQDFIAQAPVCVVFCSDPQRAAEKFGSRGRDLFALQDATIACAYAQLEVVAAGMGSTWVGQFDTARVREALAIDERYLPVAMLSIGYPAEIPELTPRRHLDDVVQYI